MSDEPEALRMPVGVGARAKMSVGWTESRLWTVRYCFDMAVVVRGNDCENSLW